MILNIRIKINKSVIACMLFCAYAFYGNVNTCFAADQNSPNPVTIADYPAYPAVNYGTGDTAALIKRGEYLAKAGDCIACHTNTEKKGTPFAGGLGIPTPFGTFYAPNITPDKETGIGNWSDQDFIRAMREGISPKGSYYFPVFPYIYFAKTSTSDLLAIKAYLFSLPPVRQANRRHDVPWPLDWRFLQLGWRVMFFNTEEYQYDNQHTAVWNRGAYLVQGLGHCGMCHTPTNLLGAPNEKYYLTGNFVGGYFAPDITGFGLQGTSVGDIQDVFVKGRMLKGAGKVEGPMAEVDHDSLEYLSPSDLQAMAVYLQSVVSKRPAVAKGPVSSGTGKKIYESHCAVCHGTGAAGAPKIGDDAAWAPRVKQGMDVIFQHAINGLNSMPPKGTCMTCSDEEIKAAAQYLVDSSKPGAGGASATPTVKQPPKLGLDAGKKIYDETCSVCHNQGLLGAPKIGDKAAWAPRIKENMDVLFTHAIKGYNRMPAKGTCVACTDEEIEAAVIYMVEQSKTNGDYSLW